MLGSKPAEITLFKTGRGEINLSRCYQCSVRRQGPDIRTMLFPRQLGHMLAHRVWSQFICVWRETFQQQYLQCCFLPYLCSILSQSLLITRYSTKSNRTLARSDQTPPENGFAAQIQQVLTGLCTSSGVCRCSLWSHDCSSFHRNVNMSLWTKGNSLFPLLDESFSRMGWKSDKVITRLL